MDGPTREAQWAETPPDCDGEHHYWCVGRKSHVPGPGGAFQQIDVTRISVQQDLPGLHCNMWRVCIWSGDTMIAEVPLHSTAGVGYPLPEATP